MTPERDSEIPVTQDTAKKIVERALIWTSGKKPDLKAGLIMITRKLNRRNSLTVIEDLPEEGFSSDELIYIHLSERVGRVVVNRGYTVYNDFSMRKHETTEPKKERETHLDQRERERRVEDFFMGLRLEQS